MIITYNCNFKLMKREIITISYRKQILYFLQYLYLLHNITNNDLERLFAMLYMDDEHRYTYFINYDIIESNLLRHDDNSYSLNVDKATIYINEQKILSNDVKLILPASTQFLLFSTTFDCTEDISHKINKLLCDCTKYDNCPKLIKV
jgi:hypothetical protein